MKSALFRLTSLAVLVAGLSGTADAGLIVLSGDTNIAEPLTGNGTPINVGNQQFFRNVLGAGTRVLVTNSNSVLADTDTNQFYNTLSGVTSTITSGPITSSLLGGVNLLVSVLPETAYTQTEIAAISTFSQAGGSLLILGEFGSYSATATVNINALLTGIGSGLRLTTDTIDAGYITVSGSRILSDPLTTGVSSFTYAATGAVTGGRDLFLTQGGTRFVAAEGSAAVPEPSTLALSGTAMLIGLAWANRRRARTRA